MIRLSKSVLAVGGVVLAGGLIMVMNPRTVHAVAAALVQVTNTATNPVVTQSVTQQAAQIVEVDCTFDYPEPNGPRPCQQLGGTGEYTVPTGQNLVITTIDISPLLTNGGTCAGTVVLGTGPGPNFFPGQWLPRATWAHLAGPQNVHFTYPTGMVFTSGQRIGFANELGPCIGTLYLYGYVTPS